MTRDPPSTLQCRTQMNRLIVFNKHEVHAIFSSHGEVTPRLWNYIVLITTTEFADSGHNKLFATTQKSTRAANSAQEIGWVLRQVAHIQLSLKLWAISTTLGLSLTPMCAHKQQAWHYGCGHISWFTWNKLTHQKASSGLRMGKGELRLLHHRCTLLKPVWSNLVYKSRISLHNIWDW